MGDPIDTGPGGFGIDGNQELFDLGLPEPQHPEKPYGPYLKTIDVSSAYTGPDGTPKDLTVVTKTTLSKYLSGLTNGSEGSAIVPNAYPIQPGYHVEAITAADGNPNLQTPGGIAPDNTPSFSPKPNDTTSLSNFFTFTQKPGTSPPLQKGKSSSQGTSGNDLLPGLPGTVAFTAADGNLTGDSPSIPPTPLQGHPDTTGVIAPYVSAVLGSNRFTSAAAGFGSSPSGNAGFNPSMTQQTKLGAYDPHARTVNTDQLATVGPLLTMRAGLSLGANSPGADPNGAALQAGALLPGFGQLGIKQVDPSTLFAADILRQLTSDALSSSDVLNIGSESWGQLNNVDDPYSGTDAIGMLTLALALIAGMELLFTGLDTILGMITPFAKQPTHDVTGRYTLGQYFANQKPSAAAGGIGGAISALSSLNFGALLGILPTTYPFQQAMSQGLNAFFQLPPPTGGLGGLVSAVGAVVGPAMDSPGYYSVVARAIIRSGITIVDQLKKIGGNVMSAINAILSLIDVLRSSKIISAVNIFATLGDAILTQPGAWADPNDPTGTKVSAQDSYLNAIPASAVTKNRLQGVLKLAWASNRAGAQLILPSGLMVAGVVLGTGQGQSNPFLGLQRDPYSYVGSALVNASAGGRIDTITAQTFEAKLEAQYVPFYFHDVRTNEMVSFHAFIASITDDYAAEYDKSKGMGRVEAVKTYAGTERHINMSFYIAATSLADFDDMWIKINKLVTLVYPQYTQGTQVSSADGSSYVFTQPFSQLVGASPLVRIRLGDLFRSNYTPFALGRLFGLGNQGFSPGPGASFMNGDSLSQGDLASLNAALRNAFANPAGNTFLPAHGVYPQYVAPAGGGIGVSLPSPPVPGGLLGGSSSGVSQATQFVPDGAYFEVKATQTYPGSPDLIVATIGIRTDAQFVNYLSSHTGMGAALLTKYANSADPVHNFVGGTYVFPASALTPTTDTLTTITSQNASLRSALDSNSTFATSLGSFLNPNNNALAKSFQDTGGKGLAGVIETMSFDWYDKVTWETQLGSIAPKICKVTIGFSPIHDISPGIDHMGANRAPVYPVGISGHDDISPTPIS
jgi:hypothetical protein